MGEFHNYGHHLVEVLTKRLQVQRAEEEGTVSRNEEDKLKSLAKSRQVQAEEYKARFVLYKARCVLYKAICVLYKVMRVLYKARRVL